MVHSIRFTCVLDTNVIYPIEVRDLLFWFAYSELYTPKWSKHIFSEWEDVMRRKRVSEAEIKKRISWANKAFPDAMVENYSQIMNGLELPDPKDCHVLAAAIKTNANVIVTNNLKDFPPNYLASYGLAAKSADDFLTDTIDLNPEIAIDSFRKLVLNRRNPDLDAYQVLDGLRRNN
ncbi:MAG: PIN domain-containing protein, partial [Bacteroidota bacterium]